MHKHISSFLALLCAAQMALATVSPTVTLTTYYASADGKSGETLRSALSAKISPHTTVSYDALKYLFKWTDTYNNAGATIDDIYSFCDPAYTESWCSGTCGYNREHSVPKSWFGEASPLYSDAFHLYPTNCYVNSYRGNEPFGECANGTKCTTNGVQAKGRKGASTFPGYTVSGVVYEPDDEFKGDLARTYFYMVTCYMSSNFTQAEGGRMMFTYSNSTAQLSAYSIDLLLKWHRQDPVSERELARNEVIYGNTTLNKSSYKQGNRNPFIDYPELAEYIWGNKKGQSVSLSSLVSPYDGGTPVTPVDPHSDVVKHGVIWSVNGEILRTDSVIEDGKIVEMPDEPNSCSDESSVFMGWTDAPIAGIQNEAPETLYKLISDFPEVAADVVYYAVFAQATEQAGAAPATYTYSADSKEGWTNTATTKGSYWLLDQGKALTSPSVDLAGLNSIKVRMRTYGGTQYDQLQVAAGTNVITTIEATSGSTMTDYEWNNTQSLSGNSPITFTCSNAGSGKGIGFESVTINATGTGVSYSNYLTSCDGASTGIENEQISIPTHKILRDGQLLIVIGDQIYNVMGQKIQ